MPIIKKKIKGGKTTFYFLSLPVYRIKQGSESTKHYVLGIKTKTRKNKLADFSGESRLQNADGENAAAEKYREISSQLFNVYDSLNIHVNPRRPRTVNLLIPAIQPSLSAGPLSALHFGHFIQKQGYHVRVLVYMMNGADPQKLKEIISSQEDSLKDFGKEIELEVLNTSASPALEISENDMSVAVLFNSSFFAHQIQSFCKNKKFINFIQDDERCFFQGGSLYSVVEQSYNLDCYPIISTEILQQAFLTEDIGHFRSKNIRTIVQDSASNCFLPDWETFSRQHQHNECKKLVFYARPHIPRNCFELGLISLIDACRKNVFSDEWQFYGVGFPEASSIPLGQGKELIMLPNMPMDQYKKMLSTFDIGLSLMCTPHSNMPVIDFALSGNCVVTNCYKNKNQAALSKICKNILAADFNKDALVETLRTAAKDCTNLEKRYQNARESSHPTNWDDVFGEKHQKWLKDIMENHINKFNWLSIFRG